MRLGAAVVGLVVVGLAVAGAGCRRYEEYQQQHLRQLARREAACYALPLRDATLAVRAVLTEEGFPLPPLPPEDPGYVATGWKDTTVGASRLTWSGRPARERCEVLLTAGPCLRFAVRAVTEETPKEGPTYSDAHRNEFDEDQLPIKIDERLQPHARAWAPPR